MLEGRSSKGRKGWTQIRRFHLNYCGVRKRLIRAFYGLASKNLNGYIRWLEVQLAGVQPAELIQAS